MKFTVNRESFIEAIRPAMEVAGKSSKKYDVEKYLGVTSLLVDECERAVSKAIRSAFTKCCQDEKYNSLNRARNDIEKEACAYLRRDFNQLRRVTIDAQENEIIVSSTNGLVTVTTIISGDDLTALDYKFEEKGLLTVETGHLWIFLQSLERYDRLIFSYDCDCRVLIQSEKKGAERRFEKFLYHVEPTYVYNPIMVAKISPKTFADGLKNVAFAVEDKNCAPDNQHLVVKILPKRLRLVGSNGELIAVNDIHCAHDLHKKKVGLMIDRNLTRSLIKFLTTIGGDEVEICYAKDTRSKKYIWPILFRQGHTILSVPVENYNNKKFLIDEYLKHDYKHKVIIKPDDWKLIIGNKKCPIGIAGLPVADIKLDFVEGYFNVKHGHRIKTESSVPFIYDSSIRLVDIESITSDETLLTPNSGYFVQMLQKGKPQDHISIELGVNRQKSHKKKKAVLEDMILATYPVKEVKARGTKEQLFLIFPRKSKDNQ